MDDPVTQDGVEDMPFADAAGGGKAGPPAGSGTEPDQRRWAVLLPVCAGYFMVILDVAVINVAVPSIGREMAVSLTGIQWITDGYTLVFAGFLLSGGALGDRLGSRRVFCAGLVVFTVASAACALAPGVGFLVAGRLAEGFGAALIVPSSLALLRHTYADQATRAWAIGVWAGGSAAAGSAGPLVGGMLIATVGWRWVFLINLPIGVACLVLTLRHVARSSRDTGRTLDWPAQCAVVAAVALLTAALNEAGGRGWSNPVVLTAAALIVPVCVAFVIRERHARSPAVPLRLLRSRAVNGTAAIGMLLSFGVYGMLFTASLDFQRHHGFSALATGFALLPSVMMSAFAAPLAAHLSHRTGQRPVMLIGMLLGALGLGGWVAAGHSPAYPLLIAPMMAVGTGTAFALTGATSTVMIVAPARYSGTASALFNTGRQVGAAAGVALGGTLLATAGEDGSGVRLSMAAGSLAYLTGAALAWLYVPRDPGGR